MTERRKSPTSPPSSLTGSAVSVEILSDEKTKKRRPDPMAVVIFGATGGVTRAVFVDGRLSMRHGSVAGIYLDAARRRAQAQF